MASSKRKKDQWIIGIVITVSIVGLFYFGYKVVSQDSRQIQENPFEYDLEYYKKSGENLVHYEEIRQIPVDLPNVYGLSIDLKDHIYVSGDDFVLIMNSLGEVQFNLTISDWVSCLAVDENGEIYLGMNDHIEVFSPDGTRKALWGTLGEEAIITSIAISKTSVFVADAGNLIVWKYDKSGNKLSRIGEKNKAKDIPGFIIPSPYFDVAVDSDGFLWVANTGRHSLENYTQQGDFRASWGEFSMEIEGFCGCCNPSHFIVLEDGSFVTSEKGIPRVKVYNRLGNVVSVVALADQFAEGTAGLDLAADSMNRIYVLDPPKRAIRVFERKED